jgi:hypothetical protein
MTAAPARLERLTRLSRVMEMVTLVGIVLIGGLTALVFVIPEWTRNFVLAKLGQAGAALPVTPAGQLLAGLITAVPLAVLLYGLWAVRRLFQEFARGRIFTVHAARCLQTFAVTVLAQALLSPLAGAGVSLALTFAQPGRRSVMLGLSTNDYLALIIGGVLLAVATVMREAARLAEENAGFV